MKPVLIDASSAILIFKAGIFDELLAAYGLAMTPAVIQEVCVAGRAGAAAFQQALANRRVRRMAAVETAAEQPELNGLGAGERETLMTYGRDVRFVIIDDRKAALLCKNRQIPYINALLCVRILYTAGYIDGPICKNAVSLILETGRYARDILQFVKGCDDDQLIRFLPEKVYENKRFDLDIKSFIK